MKKALYVTLIVLAGIGTMTIGICGAVSFIIKGLRRNLKGFSIDLNFEEPENVTEPEIVKESI